MKSITIRPPAPEVVSAILNRYGDILVVKFDQKVELDADCANIISWPWTVNDGKCELLLLIKLSIEKLNIILRNFAYSS